MNLKATVKNKYNKRLIKADKTIIVTKDNRHLPVGLFTYYSPVCKRTSFKSDRSIIMTPVYDVILLGNSHVGKSSLLSFYVNGEVPKQSQPTEGVEYLVKTINERSIHAKLKIWDTAGHKRFKDILRKYYTNVNGALLVYDIYDRESYVAVQEWSLELNAKKVTPRIVIALLGHQADIPENRVVTTEEAQRFAERNGFIFWETFTTTNLNINKCFLEVAIAIKEARVCCCCLENQKSHWYD